MYRIVFGYEDDCLKVVGKGGKASRQLHTYRVVNMILYILCFYQKDEGLEEMFGEFVPSKIMYGYARVQDPNTALPKFVFINWVLLRTAFHRCQFFNPVVL